MKRKEPKYKYEHVMLIDDNDLDNFISNKMMEAVHFSKMVYVNSSSKSALEFLGNLALTEKGRNDIYPQLIFIDINMPLMDGFQFIESYQKLVPQGNISSKLIILTSSIHPEDRVRAGLLSKDIVFLNKPLTQAMLESL